ncbi:nuclear transport factor 2 family protein [Streptomyces sp. NPDC057137]|uniref:nuclear transport factor 2 family protein n=1 Tax=Streptomyces sp. NPDC057137 TaxID=3346030 RepID=UPI0036452DE0
MTHQPAGAADHFALTRLLTETAWRIDHGRADTVWELFTEDGEMLLGGTALRGRDAIRRWGAERGAARTRHVHTNMRFDLTGENTAEGVCVLTVYMDDGRDGAAPFAVNEETGRYVRTEDGWRFASRVSDVLFGGPNAPAKQAN